MAKGKIEYLRTISGLAGGSISDQMLAAYAAAGGQVNFYKVLNGANKDSLDDNRRAYYLTKTGKTGSTDDLEAYYWANPT